MTALDQDQFSTIIDLLERFTENVTDKLTDIATHLDSIHGELVDINIELTCDKNKE